MAKLQVEIQKKIKNQEYMRMIAEEQDPAKKVEIYDKWVLESKKEKY